MKTLRFTHGWPLFVLFFLLVPISLCAQDVIFPEAPLKGRKFSAAHGILSKIQRLQNQTETSPAAVPFYKNPKNAWQMGLQPKVNKTGDTNTIDYGFHGHIYGGMNIPFASVADANGNFYITGGSSNTNQPEGNFTTVKVDATGNVLWEARQPGTEYAVEYGMAMGMDPSGNPIAAGVDWNGDDMDLEVVKYDAATGNALWETTYDGGNLGLDAPAVITTDATGNIYVAGITYTGTNIAFLTLKYDSTGTLLWAVADTNPLPDSWNEPSAIAVDNSGNVVVTGYTGDANYYAGYYTIKYDSTGVELWSEAHHYQPGGANTNSFAKDVDFDASGNYYVTGIFGDNEIIGTIKYDSAGVEQWVKTYQTGTDHTRAFEIEVVSPTEIYVAGAHFGSWVDDGLVLLSYQDDGTQNWVQETNDLIEIREAYLDLDSNSQPVIAGLGQDTASSDQLVKVYKYDAAGTQLSDSEYLKVASSTMGVQAFTGMDMGDDQSVYISLDVFYTAEGGVYEYGKLSLDPADTAPVWTGTFSNDGNTRSSMLHSITDGNNNTYTTSSFGAYENGSYITKISVIKYDDQGDVAWEKIYNPSANGYGSTGILVNVNAAGEVVVFLSPGVYETDPLRLKKYDAQGNLLWDIQKNVHYASLYVLLTDANDNIYIAGSSKENASDPSAVFTAMKFSATGTELWASFEDSGNSADNIFAVSAGGINSQGDLILTGASGVGTMFSEEVDLAVIKFDSNGTLVSFDSFPDANKNTSGTDLLIDQNDNVYINGVAQDKASFNEEMLLKKLDDQNVELWTSLYGETGRNVRSYTLDRFSTGEILVSGRSYVVGQDNKVVLVKFDTAGNQVWATNSDLHKFYKDMYLDDLDIVNVLYQVQTGTNPYRLYYAVGPLPLAGMWRVDASGTAPQPEELFFGPELSQFYPTVLIPLENNTLLMGGDLTNEAAFFEGLYFFESTHGILGIDTPEIPTQSNNWLGQNYPNPVSNRTTVPFHLKNGGEVSIQLYTIMGRKLMDLAEGTFPPGASKIAVDLSRLKPGVYIYQAQANGRKAARKLIVE